MSIHNDIERVFYSNEEIQAKVKELGEAITRDYQGKNPIFKTLSTASRRNRAGVLYTGMTTVISGIHFSFFRFLCCSYFLHIRSPPGNLLIHLMHPSLKRIFGGIQLTANQWIVNVFSVSLTLPLLQARGQKYSAG